MERKTPEKWMVNLVGKMYRDRVTQTDLADVIGCSRVYVTQMFSGTKNPPDMKEKLESAYEAVLERRKELDAWVK